MGSKEHKKSAPEKLKFSVITLSDSLSEGEGNDISGDLIEEELRSEGNKIVERVIIPDERIHIIKEISRLVLDTDTELIVTTGGTGVSRRDKTIETVRRIFDKEIEGFGEIFRKLSYDEVGTASILSRATAGIIDDVLVFCLPGSENAVSTGLEIVKEESFHIKKHLEE